MKVYISYPMNPEKHDLEIIQNETLKRGVFASIPPAGQLKNKDLGAKFDKMLIEGCEEVWAFGKLGRDCAWEIGFAVGLGKQVKIFVDENNADILDSDWMTLIDAEIVDLRG